MTGFACGCVGQIGPAVVLPGGPSGRVGVVLVAVITGDTCVATFEFAAVTRPAGSGHISRSQGIDAVFALFCPARWVGVAHMTRVALGFICLE